MTGLIDLDMRDVSNALLWRFILCYCRSTKASQSRRESDELEQRSCHASASIAKVMV